MKPSDNFSVIQLSIRWVFAVAADRKHQTTILKPAPFVHCSINTPLSIRPTLGTRVKIELHGRGHDIFDTQTPPRLSSHTLT